MISPRRNQLGAALPVAIRAGNLLLAALLLLVCCADHVFATYRPADIPAIVSNTALKQLPAAASQYVTRYGFAQGGDGGYATYSWSNTPCSLNAGAGDNGYQVAPSTGTGCWTAIWPADGMDLRVWGVVFDNSTLNGAAFSNAIAAHNLTGLPLLVPQGIAIIDSLPTSITKGGLVLRGLGVPGANACSDMVDSNIHGSILRLKSSLTTGDFLTVATEDRAIFRDFMVDFQQSSNCANVTRTSGAAFAVVGAGGVYSRNPLFENVETRYAYDAVRFDLVNAWQIHGFIALNTANDAVKLVNTTPASILEIGCLTTASYGTSI